MVTAEKVSAALAVVRTVAGAIRDAKSIPAGHLYAAMMPGGCSIEQFEGIMQVLTGAKLVERRGDLLVWVGPVS